MATDIDKRRRVFVDSVPFGIVHYLMFFIDWMSRIGLILAAADRQTTECLHFGLFAMKRLIISWWICNLCMNFLFAAARPLSSDHGTLLWSLFVSIFIWDSGIASKSQTDLQDRFVVGDGTVGDLKWTQPSSSSQWLSGSVTRPGQADRLTNPIYFNSRWM